ncbi:MAG: molybdopterin-dependent oxidoreductase [Gammaproteobacteria bacterium]|nr:molybdopterin-dependent oxidoreductase [Gammaproteobacteria bacterium]
MDKQIKTSRRNFLLGAGAGLSLHYSNAVIAQDKNINYRSWEDIARKKWTWDSITHSTHGTNCTGQCAFNVFVKNGVVWREEQQGEYGTSSDAPDYGPRGCQKGLSHSRYMYGKQRILYPLKRVGDRGEGKWERITWDQAMLEVADKFLDYSIEHGPESITCGLGTQMVMKRASYASLLRFANISGVQMPEAFAGVGDLFSGAHITFGHVTLGNTMAEIYKSKCCLIWFCNPAVTRIPDSHFFWEAKYNGTEVISISPDFNATAMHASKWLNPKPGSDIALAMAMVNTILEDKTYDTAYMKEQSDLPFLVRKDNLKYLRETDLRSSTDAKDNLFYVWDLASKSLVAAPGTGTPPVAPGTPEHLIEMPSIALEGINPALEGEWTVETNNGPVEVTTIFELTKRRAAEHTPEMAEEVTGINAEVIREVARKFAKAKPSMIYAGYRASKYIHGDLLQRAFFLLLCITGNTGKEGGGLTITNLAKDDAVFPFAMKNPAAAFRVATLSRWDYVHANMKEFNEDIYGKELAGEMDDYFNQSVKNGWFPDYSKVPWKMGIFSGTNAAAWRSSGKRWRETAFGKLDTIVTFATDMGTTAMYSDYVLPIAHHYEKHDFHLEPRTPFMQVIDKAVEPLGECIDDWAAYEKLTKAIAQRAKERNLQPIDDNVIGVPIKRDFKKYHDDYTDNGAITSVKEVIQFLLNNTSGIQNVSYDELAEKGFIRNKGSETTMHSKESPYYSDIFDSVNEKIGYKTLTHRQQFYIDHEWFFEFDEVLPRHKDALVNKGYPMKMLMGHARHGIHSMWRDDSFLLSLQRGEPDIYINPDDAKNKGVSDGELIKVHNKAGSFIAQAHVTSAMGPNMLYMYHGWDPMMFRNRQNFGAVVQTGGLIKPTSIAGGYGHIGWKPFGYEPNHAFHDYTCDFEKYIEA